MDVLYVTEQELEGCRLGNRRLRYRNLWAWFINRQINTENAKKYGKEAKNYGNFRSISFWPNGTGEGGASIVCGMAFVGKKHNIF